MTQQEIATLSGVSVSAISMAERGKRKLPLSAQQMIDHLKNGSPQTHSELWLSDEEFNQATEVRQKMISELSSRQLKLKRKLEKKKQAYKNLLYKISGQQNVFYWSNHAEREGNFKRERDEWRFLQNRPHFS